MRRRNTTGVEAYPYNRPSERKSRGRPFRADTKLGRLMVEGGWTAQELGAVSGVSPRTLTEYLALRQRISDAHLVMLADALEVSEEDLID